jgi:hypothetical protein
MTWADGVDSRTGQDALLIARTPAGLAGQITTHVPAQATQGAMTEQGSGCERCPPAIAPRREDVPGRPGYVRERLCMIA